MTTVYTCFVTSVIHEGHRNLIEQGLKYGDVIVGVLSDKAAIRFNRFPLMNTEERVALIEGMPGVSRVVV